MILAKHYFVRYTVCSTLAKAVCAINNSKYGLVIVLLWQLILPGSSCIVHIDPTDSNRKRRYIESDSKGLYTYITILKFFYFSVFDIPKSLTTAFD